MIEKILHLSLAEIHNSIRRKFRRKSPLSGFSDEHPCVFTLSTGRVGTQTLAALFSLASNVFAYHEPRPLLYGLSKMAYLYSNSLDAPALAILKEAFLLSRRMRLDFALSCNKGYVETSPQVTFLAQAIMEAIPNVRFIHLVRDPRDVVRSGMRRKWYFGHPSDKNRIVPHEGSKYASDWESLTAFQKNLWLWAETNNWILRFLSCVPEDRKMLIHSEDIFCSNEQVLEKIFGFVHASVPEINKINSALNKKLNAQRNGSFAEASEWSSEMCTELFNFTFNTARSLGYIV